MEGDKNKVSRLADSFNDLSEDEKIQFRELLNQKPYTEPMSADDSKKLAKKLVNNLMG